MTETKRFSIKRPAWSDVSSGMASGGLDDYTVGGIVKYVYAKEASTYFTAREAMGTIKGYIETVTGNPVESTLPINDIRLIGYSVVNSTEYSLGEYLASHYPDADYFICHLYDGDPTLAPCKAEIC